MASIQERLQLKRVPLDTWNIKEQLCLASAVVRSGDQNWMSVSRALKTVGEPNRPADWYSQKSCAAQYGALLEHVETPKRKKRCSEGAAETPQESIVKRLTQDRIAEIQSNLAEMNQQYRLLQNEITEVRNPATSEDRLREIWSNIEASKLRQEREKARHAALLKEREERRARAARSPRGSVSTEPPSPSASPAPPSSPLLTSLLKSSPVVTTPQHIPHPATIVDTISPSVTAPTLSMLLEKSSPQQDSKRERAAIEHIKSQLVQIEQQLKANTPPSPAPLPPAPAPAPAPAAALDIDDIEINAEDVYVFRDVDINIPAVSAPHVDKPIEKPIIAKKEEDETVDIEAEVIAPPQEEIAVEKLTEPVMSMEDIKEELPPVVETAAPVETVEEEKREEQPPPVVEEVKIAFPEVKFPTTEIKVIQPDEQKAKEESKESEITEENKQQEQEVEVKPEIIQEDENPIMDSVEQQMSTMHAEASPPRAAPEPPPQPEMPMEVLATENIPLPPEPPITELPLPPEPEPHPPEPEPQPEAPEVKSEPEAPPEPEAVEETPLDDKGGDDLKRDEDAEDSMPLKQMLREELVRSGREGPEDTHTETDDDTPMELSREEEKDGKKKRDYSRKKKPDSRTCSGSESAAEASAPESPHSSDAERQHRLWKKSVMLVYTRLCAHKYASLFLRPISDDEAPGYSVVVKKPMDLSTIRRNIESGVVRSTAEFQRAVLLMLSNALMYNSSEHSVYTMAKETHEEASSQLGMLLAAQAHAALEEEPPARRKRRRAPEPRHARAKRPH